MPTLAEQYQKAAGGYFWNPFTKKWEKRKDGKPKVSVEIQPKEEVKMPKTETTGTFSTSTNVPDWVYKVDSTRAYVKKNGRKKTGSSHPQPPHGKVQKPPEPEKRSIAEEVRLKELSDKAIHRKVMEKSGEYLNKLVEARRVVQQGGYIVVGGKKMKGQEAEKWLIKEFGRHQEERNKYSASFQEWDKKIKDLYIQLKKGQKSPTYTYEIKFPKEEKVIYEEQVKEIEKQLKEKGAKNITFSAKERKFTFTSPEPIKDFAITFTKSDVFRKKREVEAMKRAYENLPVHEKALIWTETLFASKRGFDLASATLFGDKKKQLQIIGEELAEVPKRKGYSEKEKADLMRKQGEFFVSKIIEFPESPAGTVATSVALGGILTKAKATSTGAEILLSKEAKLGEAALGITWVVDRPLRAVAEIAGGKLEKGTSTAMKSIAEVGGFMYGARSTSKELIETAEPILAESKIKGVKYENKLWFKGKAKAIEPRSKVKMEVEATGWTAGNTKDFLGEAFKKTKIFGEKGSTLGEDISKSVFTGKKGRAPFDIEGKGREISVKRGLSKFNFASKSVLRIKEKTGVKSIKLFDEDIFVKDKELYEGITFSITDKKGRAVSRDLVEIWNIYTEKEPTVLGFRGGKKKSGKSLFEAIREEFKRSKKSTKPKEGKPFGEGITSLKTTKGAKGKEMFLPGLITEKDLNAFTEKIFSPSKLMAPQLFGLGSSRKRTVKMKETKALEPVFKTMTKELQMIKEKELQIPAVKPISLNKLSKAPLTTPFLLSKTKPLKITKTKTALAPAPLQIPAPPTLPPLAPPEPPFTKFDLPALLPKKRRRKAKAKAPKRKKKYEPSILGALLKAPSMEKMLKKKGWLTGLELRGLI